MLQSDSLPLYFPAYMQREKKKMSNGAAVLAKRENSHSWRLLRQNSSELAAVLT